MNSFTFFMCSVVINYKEEFSICDEPCEYLDTCILVIIPHNS